MHSPEPQYFSAQVCEARRFHLPQRKSVRSISVVSAGWEKCRPDYEIRRESFAYPTLEFVAEGSGSARLGLATWSLRPGVLYCYDRSIPHRIQAKGGMMKYFALLRGPGVRDGLRAAGLQAGSALQLHRADKIRDLFDDLIDHGFSDHPRHEDACAAALQYLLVQIAQLAVPFGDFAGAAVGTYLRCRRIMEEHYLALSTVREVADRCHVDPSYLCRLFRRFGRENPHRYLERLRINHAVDRLQHGHRTVKDVAEELHFSDASALSRAVRRVFGVPPSTFFRRGSEEIAFPNRQPLT